MATKTEKNKRVLRRGDFYMGKQKTIAAYLNPVMRDIGDVMNVDFTMTTETITSKSGNTGLLAATRVVSKSGTLKLTMQDATKRNMALGLGGDVQTAKAVVSKAFDVPAMDEGETLSLSANLTSVEVEGLVEGEDYVLKKAAGLFIALKALTATTGTFSSEATVTIGIMVKNDDGSYRIVIDASKECGEIWTFYNAKPKPMENVSFNADSAGFAESTIEFDILAHPAAPDSGELGNLGMVQYVTEADE